MWQQCQTTELHFNRLQYLSYCCARNQMLLPVMDSSNFRSVWFIQLYTTETSFQCRDTNSILELHIKRNKLSLALSRPWSIGFATSPGLYVEHKQKFWARCSSAHLGFSYYMSRVTGRSCPMQAYRTDLMHASGCRAFAHQQVRPSNTLTRRESSCKSATLS